MFEANDMKFVTTTTTHEVAIFIITQEGFDEALRINIEKSDDFGKIVSIRPYIHNEKVWMFLGLEYGKICILDMETGEIKDYKEVNEYGKYVIEILLPNPD